MPVSAAFEEAVTEARFRVTKSTSLSTRRGTDGLHDSPLGGRWIRTIGSASWRAHEVRPDSLPERAGFELSVPGDGELCWGALTLGCIRGDRSAGAGTVQCDFFCSAGFENAQATRFFPAQHDVPTRQRSQQPTP